MKNSVIQLQTPLGNEILTLGAGDRVELSGYVYTARDEAHIRMARQGIPFDPRGAALYHSGPIILKNQILAAGPTTSSRMDKLSTPLLDAGVKALIGKGGMGEPAKSQLRGRAIYLAFTGGCAALAAAKMRLRGVYAEDLGMAEAIWVIELDHLPLVVGIDSQGHDLFCDVMERAKRLARGE